MSPINTAFSGSIPEKYDTYLGPFLFEPYALELLESVKKLPGKTILEIACGTGRVTYHLAKIPGVQLTATDLNPDMITVAKKKVSGSNVEWLTADAQNLPFQDESFDVVICQFGLMFVPDKLKAISEVFRVLKKGGHYLLSTWDKIENNAPFNTALEIVNDFFKGDPPTFYQIPYSMHDSKAIVGLLADAGFHNITADLVKKEGISETAQTATIGFIEGNPILVEINNRDPKIIGTIEATLSAKLSERFGDHPLKGELSAYIFTAVK